MKQDSLSVSRIVIIGAGVMGSALCIPATDVESNQVTLVGSPLDSGIIGALKHGKEHPHLKVQLPNSLQAVSIEEVDASIFRQADAIIIGVSSPGMDWVSDVLKKSGARPGLLAVLTKGLVKSTYPHSPPATYADALDAKLTEPRDCIVAVGGPCIARELALRIPTNVIFAARDIGNAKQLRSILQTDYYRIATHRNIVGVEACAALKNFLCIGVSAMLTANPFEGSHAKNPLAALFNQAVLEMLILSRWIEQKSPNKENNNDVAFNLAGMGDLHVTVGGGRNSKLGAYLGQGRTVKDVMHNQLKGVTVEGLDTGRRLFEPFQHACQTGVLAEHELPLTTAILNSINHNTPFNFNFNALPI